VGTGAGLPVLRDPRLIAAVAGSLAVATVVVRGADADGICWAFVQVLFVALAAEDIRSRRIPNAVTAPAAVTAIALRAALERSELIEILIAGAGAFAFFLFLALLTRGGLGMGDVKLAGLLGLLLGTAVAPALLIGTVAGGVASVAMLARGRKRGTTIAYGPYLCLGGAVAVLALNLPRLA
jgi:leader peptidase (prepilin peptidase) / N-methyltransferase